MLDIMLLFGGAASLLILLTCLICLLLRPARRRLAARCAELRRAARLGENVARLEREIDLLAHSLSQGEADAVVMNEALQSLLRSGIMTLYYRNEGMQLLRAYEKESLIRLYEAYTAVGGNSYVSFIYQSMLEWPVSK